MLPEGAAVASGMLAIQLLTGRQRQVLLLIAAGHTNLAIASILGISSKTVEYHVGQLLRRTGASSRAHVVAIGLGMGLLTCDLGNVAVQLLTGRQRQVLLLIAAGHTNLAIASILGISSKTVEYHVGQLLRRTGTSSRTQVVATGLGMGSLTHELRGIPRSGGVS